MDKKEAEISSIVEGLARVDPEALAEFEREMKEEVIPKIIRVVEERRTLAAESRQWQLKIGG
jgi:hypothetical protein